MYEEAIKKTELAEPKKEWHPRYEWVGVKARKLAKQSFLALIPYLLWGAIFFWAFERGGYPAMSISIALSILYNLKQNKKAFK
jgi:hypothetical protein